MDLKIFLHPGYEKAEWSLGIPRDCLKEEWKQVLAIIQKYVTCKGRFATIYKYHMRFLLHVAGVSKLNLPFYLLKSLSKMSAKVKNDLDYTSHSVFHHGLIKLLIDKELEKRACSWSHFLFWSSFSTGEKQGKKRKKMKLRSNKQK